MTDESPRIDLSALASRVPPADVSHPRIIGIDPGTRTVGWGIIEKRGRDLTALASGAIKTAGLNSIPERLEKIYNELFAVMETFKPKFAGVETTFMDVTRANVQSVIAMGEGRGIALLACRKAGVEILELSPNTVKQAVTGNGHADKEQVRDMVMRLLRLKHAPKPLDVSDALAIAYTAGQRVRLTARLRSRRKSTKCES